MTHLDKVASLKRAAAEAAAALVEPGMVVGLGSGSTAALVMDALAGRHRQGLRFVGIPTSEQTAARAQAAGIPLGSFAEHRQIDLTIDGADEVERGTLDAIKGLGGALLREKIVAAASRRLVLAIHDAKLVDRLGTHVPVPVEATAFGLEATQDAIESLGAAVRPRLTGSGELFATDGGNRILDCRFGPIADPAGLEARLRSVVGTVENGLFVGRADLVYVADAQGVRRLDSPRANPDRPLVLVVMGVSGAGKTTVAQALARRLGWLLAEGDAMHPDANIAKMRAGLPLDDADRRPWLESVAAWIDVQRARRQPGILTCSALARRYRQVIIGDRPDVGLVYLRGDRDLIAGRLTRRSGHFMPATLLASQLEALEEPGADEHPLVVEAGGSPAQSADAIAGRLDAPVP
jgi:ribose 5-phosphate isomerase A